MRNLSSPTNPNFKRWLRLATQPRAVRELRRSLAEGLHLAQAVLLNQYPIASLLLRRGAASDTIDGIVAAAVGSGAAPFELAPALFDRLSPVERSVGLLLEFAVPDRTLPAAIRDDVLYLDGVQDPGNAGALLRVAAAAGVREVMAAPATVGLWSPKVLRAGQGAHFALHLYEHVPPDAARASFRGTWVAAEAHEAQPLWEAAFPPGPVAWILGAEGQGISLPMRDAAALRLAIPLAAGIESLNVASAAAVCLFERRRRLGRLR
jgi:TrmH family RNA methyltransferase